MTCRYCLLACTLCNIPSTASHFLSAFCLFFFLDKLPRLCFCSFSPNLCCFKDCWIFSLCSEELYYTEKEPNVRKLTAVSEANWKSSHLDCFQVSAPRTWCRALAYSASIVWDEQFVPSFPNPLQLQQGRGV